MIYNPDQYCALPLGIVLRRTPGQTRWAKYYWRVSGVLPGAGLASGQVLRSEGDAVEVHAATVTLEMHGAETEAYVHELQAEVPSVYVILREGDTPADAPEAVLATLSPYEAQDYCDSGEELVEKIAMPPSVRLAVEAFIEDFHAEETFKKRKRDKQRVDLKADGIGDRRIAGMTDVYASPARKRERLV